MYIITYNNDKYISLKFSNNDNLENNISLNELSNNNIYFGIDNIDHNSYINILNLYNTNLKDLYKDIFPNKQFKEQKKNKGRRLKYIYNIFTQLINNNKYKNDLQLKINLHKTLHNNIDDEDIEEEDELDEDEFKCESCSTVQGLNNCELCDKENICEECYGEGGDYGPNEIWVCHDCLPTCLECESPLYTADDNCCGKGRSDKEEEEENVQEEEDEGDEGDNTPTFPTKKAVTEIAKEGEEEDDEEDEEEDYEEDEEEDYEEEDYEEDDEEDDEEDEEEDYEEDDEDYEEDDEDDKEDIDEEYELISTNYILFRCLALSFIKYGFVFLSGMIFNNYYKFYI